MISHLHWKPIHIIFLAGLLVRIAFLLFGAEIYYGRTYFFIDGDTDSYVRPLLNLCSTGEYTGSPGHEYGPFLRTPGYPFFIGIFYLLAGKNLELTYQLVIWAQTILDSINIILIFFIAKRVFENRNIAVCSSSIYACYPFAFVWTPVVQAETFSIFLLLSSVLLFLKTEMRYNYLYAGILIGIGTLTRPQLGLLLPCFIIALGFSGFIKSNKKAIIYLILGFFLLYAPWPARNYINYDKLMLFHDYRCGKEWNSDFTSFWDYIFSVKAEWEPQYSGILQNKKVRFPPNAYTVNGDSLKLEKAVYLAQNCGSSFSWRTGYWKEKIQDNEENCNEEIAMLFNELRENQIRYNPLNYFFIIPIKNLKKSLFKIRLYDQSTFVRRMASKLFLYRTILIISGFVGIFIILRKKEKKSFLFAIFTLSYAVVWYLYLCFIHRNIEIRYFITADILLILMASALICNLQFLNPKSQFLSPGCHNSILK